MRHLRLVVAGVLLMGLPVLADPQAIEWMDRATHEVQQEEGLLPKNPVNFHLYGGVYGYYTDNLFLTPNRTAEEDAAAIPFVRGRIEYSEARFEAVADALVSYDAFLETRAARNDQEHFYGKARYVNGMIDLQIVEIARHETDAVDVVYSDRAGRLITDTIPRVSLTLEKLFELEAFAQIETVHFEGGKFDSLENENYRVGGSELYRISDRYRVGVGGGYMRISYRQPRVSPNAEGYWAHAMLRAEPFEKFLVEASIGYAAAHSFHPEAGDTHNARGEGLDVELHFRWEATKDLLLEADYVRRFGFSGGGSSFQELDRVVAIAEWQIWKPLKLRLRGQVDRANPSNAPIRTYLTAGFDVEYQVIRNMAVGCGGLARYGNTHGIAGDNYDNWQAYVGVIFSY